MWTRRSAVTVRGGPGGLTPVSVGPGRLGVIGAALSGISEELAALEWDWRERSAEERALDERRPWYWPGTVVVDGCYFAEHEAVMVPRTGEVVRVVAVPLRMDDRA